MLALSGGPTMTRTKALIERADHLRHRSYFVRSRALDIAGWALVLRRDSEEQRRANAGKKSRKRI